MFNNALLRTSLSRRRRGLTLDEIRMGRKLDHGQGLSVEDTSQIFRLHLHEEDDAEIRARGASIQVIRGGSATLRA